MWFSWCRSHRFFCMCTQKLHTRSYVLSLHNSIQMANCRFHIHGCWKNLARDCHMKYTVDSWQQSKYCEVIVIYLDKKSCTVFQGLPWSPSTNEINRLSMIKKSCVCSLLWIDGDRMSAGYVLHYLSSH